MTSRYAQDDYIGDVLTRLQDQVEAQATEISYQKAYQLRVERRYETEITELLAALRAAIPVLAANRSRQGVYAYQQASAAIAKVEGTS